MSKERILVIDDEEDILELVRYNLTAEGYSVVCSDSGENALKLAKSDSFDLIVLDLMLPETDGISVAKLLKSDPKTRNIPIIMLTAKSDESDELTGFELGVDEYISKPFSPKILVARVNALLRRSGLTAGNDEKFVEAGGIKLDKTAHLVTVDGRPIELSIKEFELLDYFMENQGIALSREKILNNVWNYDYFGDARTIDTHVKKLRAKIGEKGEYIKTIWGVGYKCIVE